MIIELIKRKKHSFSAKRRKISPVECRSQFDEEILSFYWRSEISTTEGKLENGTSNMFCGKDHVLSGNNEYNRLHK